MVTKKRRKREKAFGESVLETSGKVPDLIGGSLSFMKKPKKRKKSKR